MISHQNHLLQLSGNKLRTFIINIRKIFVKLLTWIKKLDIIIVLGQVNTTHIILRIRLRSFYQTTVNCLTMSESVPEGSSLVCF